MEVLSYQPHSGKYSPFPHDELHPVSKFWTPSSSNLISRQSSIPDQNNRAESVSQLRETDDVDGDESSDDKLSSLRKLLSPTTQPPRNPSRSRSLNPSVHIAGGPAPTPPGATSAPRKSLFKNIPAWSFLNSLPTETPTSTNQAKTNNEPAVRPSVVPGRYMSRGSSIDSSVSDGRHIGRGNSQESLIVIDDDKDSDPTDPSNHTSHQMTVNDPGVGGENIDGDADVDAHTGEGVANSDGATLEEERQLHPSVQGDSIVSLPGKRSRSLSGSDRADGRGSDWVFDVFAEDDSGTEGDGSPPSKRARSSPPSVKAAANRPSPAAAVTVEGVQVPGSAHGDQPPRGDQYEVHQIVGESALEYEVTAFTRLWLPKTSVEPKLVRKYRAQQRAATRVRTRWSSRLQNKN